jgi:hypothetical protein
MTICGNNLLFTFFFLYSLKAIFHKQTIVRVGESEMRVKTAIT